MTEPINALLEFGRVTYDLLERFVVAHERIASALERGAGSSPTSSRPQGAAAPAASGGTFPPFGKSKGEPIAGATPTNLRFYAHAAIRSLGDPAKSRFHEKERQNLTAYKAELVRQGQAVDDLGDPGAKEPDMRDDEPPQGDGGRPDGGPTSDEIPF